MLTNLPLPSISDILLLSPPLFIYAYLSAKFSGWLKKQKNIPTPYTRKVFHLCIFSMAGILQLILGLNAVLVFGGITFLIVLYATYKGSGYPFYEALARPTDAPKQTFFIIVPLITTALGGLAANFLFMQYAFVGYLVCGWGDAVGEPVGTKWGKHKYKVPSLGVPATRSLEGSAAVMAVGSLAAGLGLYCSGIPFPIAVQVGISCGFGSMIVEAISNHGLDNLTIQVAASGIAFLMLS
ncbi:MAG: hypothetical protein HRT90_01075 [Candidatus Margulisbacteria bacterium]|nr:hypothetical protein [Candidatus Margulisiibacteriota bacterium]